MVGSRWRLGVVGGVVAGFAVGLAAAPQEPPPVRAGTPGVPVPALDVKVAPVDPLPLGGRESRVVLLEAMVDREGRVRNVRIIQPPPDPPDWPPIILRTADLLRDSAASAVRQWQFESRAAGPATIIVPITVRFEALPLPPIPSFFQDAPPAEHHSRRAGPHQGQRRAGRNPADSQRVPRQCVRSGQCPPNTAYPRLRRLSASMTSMAFARSYVIGLRWA